MKTSASSIFHFVRGALRGAYGQEEMRGRKVLVIGVDLTGQQLLTMFCMDHVELFFEDLSIVHYNSAHMVCPQVSPYAKHPVDVIINLPEGFITIKEKSFAIDLIGENPYNEGIHAYYL